jgi:hypothetical protein
LAKKNLSPPPPLALNIAYQMGNLMGYMIEVLAIFKKVFLEELLRHLLPETTIFTHFQLTANSKYI